MSLDSDRSAENDNMCWKVKLSTPNVTGVCMHLTRRYHAWLSITLRHPEQASIHKCNLQSSVELVTKTQPDT